MQRKTFSGRLNHRILLCRIIPGYNPKAVITKKRHLDSHRSTVTTQTQNKTRQNYYAIFLLCRGGIFTDSYIFAYLQVAIRRFAYIKHSDFYFVHERRSKISFLLLIVFQEAFHQPFGECLTIGIHHQPTLIERILDITQLHKDGSGSGMGKHV